MLLPLRDDNPHTTTPVVNYALIAACVAVFLWQVGLDDRAEEIAVLAYGLIPGTLFGKVLVAPEVHRLPGVLTIFTSMFLHGGWLHLIGNMWFLWIFGDNVEASLGHRRYFLFYALCGLAAAVGQISLDPASEVPMIGASGAISGVLGAYLILHPRANVKVLVLLIIFITVVNLPAWIVLGFWFLGQLIGQAGTAAGEPGIAFMAHIGGFVAGMALVLFFRPRSVPIFQPPASRPFAVDTRRVGFRRRVPDSDSRGPWS
jgi:membrane associated rhomboid family serine protease